MSSLSGSSTLTNKSLSGVVDVTADTITVSSLTVEGNLSQTSGTATLQDLSVPSITVSGTSYLVGVTGTSIYGQTVSGVTGSFTGVTGTSVYGETVSGCTATFSGVNGSTGSFAGVTGTSLYGQSVTGNTGSFTGVTGTSVYGQSVSGITGSFTDVTGTSLYGQSVTGNTGSFTGITGTSVYGQSVSGTTGSFTGVTGTSLYGQTVSGSTGSYSTLSVSGNITNDFLTIAPNKKGASTSNNCVTVGTQLVDTDYCDLTFTSNSQSGYTLSASSDAGTGYEAYRAFGSSSGAWKSDANFTKLGSGGGASVVISGVTYQCEWVRALLPDSVHAKSCHLTLKKVGGLTTAKDFIIAGYDSNGWHTCTTYTNNTNSDRTLDLTITWQNNRYTYLGVFITSVIPYTGNNLGVSVDNLYFTCYTQDNGQEVYIPQCLEVGRPASVNTVIQPYRKLTVSGSSHFNGDITMDNGFIFPYAICCTVRVDLDNTTTITAGDSVLASVANATFDNKPDGYETYGFMTSSNETADRRGKYRFPVTGYYNVSMGLRLANGDGGTKGLKPLIDNASYVSSNVIPNDGVVWCSMDGTTTIRRCATYSATVYGTKGYFIYPTIYSTGTVYWCTMSVSLVSV